MRGRKASLTPPWRSEPQDTGASSHTLFLAFHPLPVADGPSKADSKGMAITLLFILRLQREPSLMPGQKTENLKHRNPRHGLFHPARPRCWPSPQPARWCPPSLFRASCTTGLQEQTCGAHPSPRVMPDCKGGEKTQRSRGGWPSQLLLLGSSMATQASQPENSEDRTAGPAGHQERLSLRRRLLPSTRLPLWLSSSSRA